MTLPAPTIGEEAQLARRSSLEASRQLLMPPLGLTGEVTEFGVASVRPPYGIIEMLCGLRYPEWEVEDLAGLVTVDDVIRAGLMVEPATFPIDRIPDVQRAIDVGGGMGTSRDYGERSVSHDRRSHRRPDRRIRRGDHLRPLAATDHQPTRGGGRTRRSVPGPGHSWGSDRNLADHGRRLHQRTADRPSTQIRDLSLRVRKAAYSVGAVWRDTDAPDPTQSANSQVWSPSTEIAFRYLPSEE